MYIKPLLTLSLSVLLFLPSIAQEYSYTETTDNKSINYQITKSKPEAGLYMIEMKDAYRLSRHYITPMGSTVRWQHTDTELAHNFEVKRTGNNIAIHGTFKGNPINKTVEIDKDQWFNKVDHALSDWVRSDEDELDFWILKLSSDLDPLKIRAEKVGTETLKLDDGTFQAIKVKLTLCSFFMSNFWSSYYWYREDDGLFLKFTGAMGLPGTPTTTIELTQLADK